MAVSPDVERCPPDSLKKQSLKGTSGRTLHSRTPPLVVNLRRHDVPVSEQFFHFSDINASVKQEYRRPLTSENPLVGQLISDRARVYRGRQIPLNV